MQVEVGAILVSKKNQYYRVLETYQDAVSLVRVNGHTIFACRSSYLETEFRPVDPWLSLEITQKSWTARRTATLDKRQVS